MSAYVVGIDTSTTATKAVIVDVTGNVVASESSEYGVDIPRSGWSEQHPHLWWDASVTATRLALDAARLSGEDIAAVGLTGQMHGLVTLDDRGEVIRPAILWNDQRTAVECEEMRRRVGRDRLIGITGNDAMTGFTAPKLLWMRNNEPESYRRVATVLLPKDYVRYRMTGEFAVDRAGGSGTHLFDLAKRDWSPELVDVLDFERSWFPSSHEGPTVTGLVTHDAAAAMGLRPGTPVMAGGGDQAATAVGTGAITEGTMSLSLGTSGVVFAASSRPRVDPEGAVHAFCHAVPDTWHMMGVMLSAAGSLRWYRDTFAPNTDFGVLAAEAEEVVPGSEGVTFLPYLTGERTPHVDPEATGAFLGLRASHGRPALTRAVLEGVAFGLRDSLELMYSTGIESATQIRIAGGGTRSPVWRQIIADVLGTELIDVMTTEGAAFGAATLAAVGVGWFADVSAACEAWVRLGATTPPRLDASAYDEAYRAYRSLYPALRNARPR